MRKVISINYFNKYTVQIPACNGNRYVISDIHGCLKTLEKLVSRINLKKEDQLFLLGDYIDRGPDSVGVLDYIIDLQEKFQVYSLRGNHEESLLRLEEADVTIDKEFYVMNEKTFELFDFEFELKEKYFNFLDNLPYFFVLEKHILVHAGLDFHSYDPYLNLDKMLWIRDMRYNPLQAMNKTIVHGHTPFELPDIQRSIKQDKKVIPLDNGCVYHKEKLGGNLLCYNLGTKELIIQKNIDFE